jgi:DNA-binding GntR family transcriptional regulator
MPLQADPSSPTPLYAQIREQLRQQMLSGALKPGDSLPGEAQIAAETGVSRMTARAALAQLAREGLLVRRRGKGSFVAEPKRAFQDLQFPLASYTQMMERAGFRTTSRICQQRVVPAEPPVARQLALSEGEAVIHIERLRSVNDEAMSLESSYYPYSRFPSLAEEDLTDRSIYAVIEARYAIVPSTATQTVELSVAGAYEAARLGILEGTPVALSDRVSCSEDGRPMEYTRVIHRGDRFRSVTHLTRADLLGQARTGPP